MRKLLTIFALLLSPLSAFATFGAATAWDVRTTGANTNGGAFDSGATLPGTNESLGSGVAITCTLASTTTATCSPAISSTTHGPGNFINIASGSGCTTGWFEITSQSAGTGTFDHAMGTATNVCVGVIGGSLSTIAQANTNIVSGNTIWIQSGTYTQTTSLTWAVSTGNWTGYQTTHGDNGTKPLITTATNSVVLINTASSNGGIQIFTNLSLSNTAGTRASGIWQFSAHGTTQHWVFVRCLFDGFSTAIDDSNGSPDDVGYIDVFNTEIKNTTGAGLASGGNVTLFIRIFGSYFHNNDTHVSTGSSIGPVWIEGSIFANGTGTFGLPVAANIVVVDRCTFANNSNATQTLSLSGSNQFFSLTNSIFYGNTGTAFGASNVIALANAVAAGASNAFGNNFANGWTGSSGDVTITANPFTASGSGDYSLNSTAGGGAALKGAGFPGVFPGATTTGHLDIGAVQAASGGGVSTSGNYGLSN